MVIFTRIKKDTNTNDNAKKKGILGVLSTPFRYIKSKVKGAYNKLVKKQPKKLKMKYIMKKI